MLTATLTQQSSPASIRSSQKERRRKNNVGKKKKKDYQKEEEDFVRQSLAVKDQIFFLENRSHCLKIVEEGRLRQ